MKKVLLHTFLLAAALFSAPEAAFADEPVAGQKAKTASCTEEVSSKNYIEQIQALGERQIEVEEKDGKANFRVLDCDGGNFRIYNLVGKLVFTRKIEGDVWLCSVPLTQGIYIVSAGKYARKFTMVGKS